MLMLLSPCGLRQKDNKSRRDTIRVANASWRFARLRGKGVGVLADPIVPDFTHLIRVSSSSDLSIIEGLDFVR